MSNDPLRGHDLEKMSDHFPIPLVILPRVGLREVINELSVPGKVVMWAVAAIIVHR